MKRVVLVDDHALVRTGIRFLIEQVDDFVVVGEASGNAEALELVQRLQPGLLVTDITMGDDNGLDLLEEVGRLSPGPGS